MIITGSSSTVVKDVEDMHVGGTKRPFYPFLREHKSQMWLPRELFLTAEFSPPLYTVGRGQGILDYFLKLGNFPRLEKTRINRLHFVWVATVPGKGPVL
jgi:hypothetical protein